MPDLLHPVVAAWFAGRYAGPTHPQRFGWPEIAAGRHTLIAAPTGSGKTLTAFLICIDQLLREGLAGGLPEETRVVYVSPLKALSNDIHRNLEVPLAEIQAQVAAAGLTAPPIRVGLRTGDTPASQRQAMLRHPPHILVTTPESLYLLLTGERSRQMLRHVRTIIVDEIHALARDKRGSHLALSLERLEAQCEGVPQRIGLSATQRPIDEIARFLVGTRRVNAGLAECSVVDAGHARDLDLAVEVPPSELSAVCSHETWAEIYARLAELITAHRSTLLFVNTRRMAERIAHQLSELLGAERVASHHGSLSREIRLAAERRLQAGELKVIVATASLELGIDVGFIDLVCQLGSPRSIATFLQRVGRSGHCLGLVPKGRLFALTRDELLECLALVRAVRQGRLDAVEIPEQPLDILAQQVVAATATEDWSEDELFALCTAAWPYRNLTRATFDAVIKMLSQGITRGVRATGLLHRDGVHSRIKARRGARITALNSGGAIPDTGDYRVLLAEDRTFVGTLNEDFAIESTAGDVFQLGNSSWRIQRITAGEVHVQDAQAAPATLPFWLGEAPGRTIELSAEVSALRTELATRPDKLARGTHQPAAFATALAPSGESCDARGVPDDDAFAAAANDPPPETALSAEAWLQTTCGASPWGAKQAVDFVRAQQAALGLVPTQERIVFERFFDDSGGMQLVIHSPYGMRINRAWGLALRKRFCRSFDFELQASADDNGIVLSLGPQHSFALELMFKMLSVANARPLLEQALLAVPMFRVRWRWNATRALAVVRQRSGKRVPPALQRFQSDDLLTSVFPAQTACQENQHGDIQIPEHPLVQQTVHDCLHEAMDLTRFLELLGRIEAGQVELIARQTTEPSPFSYQLLNANPYAFLDPAPLEERRARAVATRRSCDPAQFNDLSWLDPRAVEQVCGEAQPLIRDADELHDALLSAVLFAAGANPEVPAFLTALIRTGRASAIHRAGREWWVATECLPTVRALWPDLELMPPVPQPAETPTYSEALVALVRGHLETCGPVTAMALAALWELPLSSVEAGLAALEGEGAVVQGRFVEEPNAALQPVVANRPPPPAAAVRSETAEVQLAPTAAVQWCHRRLLARIHRLTLSGARQRIQPVTPAEYWRFLLAHQGLDSAPAGGRGELRRILAQLQGFEAAAGAWEREILPARLADYECRWLDELCLAGEVAWGRLRCQRVADAEATNSTRRGMTRVVPISLLVRENLSWLLPLERNLPLPTLSSVASQVWELLTQHGALFAAELAAGSGLLTSQLDDALGELAAWGLVTADGFQAVRQLVRERDARGHRGAWRRAGGAPKSGRYVRFPGLVATVAAHERAERWAALLLERYGVVFRDLLARESVAPAWHELVAIYRRQEAQGRIRGGRFVSGVAGEQFAREAVVEQLRAVRDAGASSAWTVVSAADPANLAGIITAGARVPAAGRNALAILDGRLVAVQSARTIEFLEEQEPITREAIRRALRLSTAARRRVAMEPVEGRWVRGEGRVGSGDDRATIVAAT